MVTRQACKWKDAGNLGPLDYYIEYCYNDGDADWCAYSCIDANGDGNSWYYEEEIEHACSHNSWTDEAANAHASAEADAARGKRMMEQKIADTQAQEA